MSASLSRHSSPHFFFLRREASPSSSFSLPKTPSPPTSSPVVPRVAADSPLDPWSLTAWETVDLPASSPAVSRSSTFLVASLLPRIVQLLKALYGIYAWSLGLYICSCCRSHLTDTHRWQGHATLTATTPSLLCPACRMRFPVKEWA
ncbi:hypothetical protein ASPFODRAFT_669869 [Aspergillus luchuensis CBS 106.47]|uniref:Uncharacterized protein n=1 Tax=Aspergillus luchuensis (strain CBS 106.47) TaxID=1137211 RepID=A0A1M3SY93_ASPLC|nr:hypothetical protein ASPFODRAFT_669869 [Aspergillus luchuensis CBS 106.47]